MMGEIFDLPTGLYLRERIDSRRADAFSNLERIDEWPLDVALQICGEILTFACDAQNELTIRVGREAFGRLPYEWVVANLGEAVHLVLDLKDYWHYLYLLILIASKYPDLLKYYRDLGMDSDDPEIIDAASDFLGE